MARRPLALGPGGCPRHRAGSARSRPAANTPARPSPGDGAEVLGLERAGQLGDGSTIDRPGPVEVNGLASGVVAISAGGRHTCALLIEGAAKCWGYGEFGQLGGGTTADSEVPADVSGPTSGVCRDNRRGKPDLRAHDRWRGDVLGIDPQGATDIATVPTVSRRSRQRCSRGQGRLLPRVCGDGRPICHLLGRKRRRTGGQWDDQRQLAANPGGLRRPESGPHRDPGPKFGDRLAPGDRPGRDRPRRADGPRRMVRANPPPTRRRNGP